jgi:hypothetical protein
VKGREHGHGAWSARQSLAVIRRYVRGLVKGKPVVMCATMYWCFRRKLDKQAQLMSSKVCPWCWGRGSETHYESRRAPLGHCGSTMISVPVEWRCPHCMGTGYIDEPNQPTIGTRGGVPSAGPKHSVFDSLAEGGAWFVERIPPLNWLTKFGKSVMAFPSRYSWCLAVIGGVVGMLYGWRSRDTSFIALTTLAGAFAGRALLPMIGIVLAITAMMVGVAIVLAILAGCILAVYFLLEHRAR